MYQFTFYMGRADGRKGSGKGEGDSGNCNGGGGAIASKGVSMMNDYILFTKN